MNDVTTYDAAEFGQWFLCGFRDHYNPDQAHMAFRGSDIYLQRPLVPELKRIYDNLPSSAQQSFREGLGIAVDRMLSSGEMDGRIMDQIFTLSARLEIKDMSPRIETWLQSGSPQLTNGSRVLARSVYASLSR